MPSASRGATRSAPGDLGSQGVRAPATPGFGLLRTKSESADHQAIKDLTLPRFRRKNHRQPQQFLYLLLSAVAADLIVLAIRRGPRVCWNDYQKTVACDAHLPSFLYEFQSCSPKFPGFSFSHSIVESSGNLFRNACVCKVSRRLGQISSPHPKVLCRHHHPWTKRS